MGVALIQSAMESASIAAAKVLSAKTRAACRTQYGAEWFMGSSDIRLNGYRHFVIIVVIGGAGVRSIQPVALEAHAP